VAANTLNHQFTVEFPNRVWAGDLTYLWTAEGWLYLAGVLDLYSRAVIGWAMGHRLTVDLAERAHTMALANRTPHGLGSCTIRTTAVSMLQQATSACSMGPSLSPA